MDRIEANRLLLRARGMAAFRGVLGSEAGQNFLALLELLATSERPDPASVASVYARLWGELINPSEPLLDDAWRSHLVERILESEHPFAVAAGKGDLGSALVEQARLELHTLRALFDLDAETLLGFLEEIIPELAGTRVSWRDSIQETGTLPRRILAEKLAASGDWGKLPETLA